MISVRFSLIPEDIVSRMRDDIPSSGRWRGAISPTVAEKKAVSRIAGLMAADIAGYPGDIAHDQSGKPYLPDSPDIHISISHCGRFAAVSRGEVLHGIDAERIREPRERIIYRAFCPGDRDFIRAAGDKGIDELGRAFFLVWTRKEALVKAAGLTLGEGMKVDICPGGRLSDEIILDGKQWSFTSFERDGYIISVCVQGEPEDIGISPICDDELWRIRQNLLER